jgi:hypothetical protein
MKAASTNGMFQKVGEAWIILQGEWRCGALLPGTGLGIGVCAAAGAGDFAEPVFC